MLRLFYDPVVGIAFWVFVAVVVLAALWHTRARNQEKHRTIRLAIEKGMPLDAALIAALDKPRPARPEGYAIGAFITLAAGLGLVIMGFFLAPVAAQALYPLIGAGLLTMLVGIGLLAASRWLKSKAGPGRTE